MIRNLSFLDTLIKATNRPFYSCPSYANDAVILLISRNLHNKSSEVSIKTRSTPASVSFNGQATKHNCKMVYLVYADQNNLICM